MKIILPFPYKRYIEKVITDRKIQLAVLGIFVFIIVLTVYALQKQEEI
jgi:hypothetical protein